MSVVLNTKHLSGFINEEEYKAIYPQVEAAHRQLEAKNGPGNDFLGWMYLPRDYDKEEFVRIKEAAQLGFKRFIVPRGSFMNGKKAPAGVVECRTVEEAIGAMFR